MLGEVQKIIKADLSQGFIGWGSGACRLRANADLERWFLRGLGTPFFTSPATRRGSPRTIRLLRTVALLVTWQPSGTYEHRTEGILRDRVGMRMPLLRKLPSQFVARVSFFCNPFSICMTVSRIWNA